MAAIHITDIEAAINYWREQKPSPDGVTLAPEIRALAEVYALMIYYHHEEAAEKGFPPKAYEAWLGWYNTTPDAPCIAICSTSQGDEECKGCGRTFEEVQYWPEMSPGEKRSTWRRITMIGTSWRFNKYAERALASSSVDVGAPTTEGEAKAGA
jgi:uncharacterized protein